MQYTISQLNEYVVDSTDYEHNQSAQRSQAGISSDLGSILQVGHNRATGHPIFQPLIASFRPHIDEIYVNE